MEPKWRDMMSRLKMDRMQCEYQIGERELVSLYPFFLTGVIDMQFHSMAYHYMLRPEIVPVIPYPWLPNYEEYDENFDFSLFESSMVVEESSVKWWLETRISGYSLTWKNLSRHLWWKLYHIKLELFFTPWIPLAHVRFWENQFRLLMVQLFKE
jgi:hypothetical protein